MRSTPIWIFIVEHKQNSHLLVSTKKELNELTNTYLILARLLFATRIPHNQIEINMLLFGNLFCFSFNCTISLAPLTTHRNCTIHTHPLFLVKTNRIHCFIYCYFIFFLFNKIGISVKVNNTIYHRLLQRILFNLASAPTGRLKRFNKIFLSRILLNEYTKRICRNNIKIAENY